MQAYNPVLNLFVPLYRRAVDTRLFLYRKGLLKKIRLPVRVISVGNITVGGTGKTTVVCHLARHFQALGRRTAVVSHGVGGRRDMLVVSDGRKILADVRQSGDEAYLLAEELHGIPVLSGRKREEAVGLAIERFSAEVVILDDAFHYLRLDRDCDILVFNCFRQLGNNRLLPAGPLREPLPNINRANVIWLNHTDLVSDRELADFRKSLQRYNPEAAVTMSHYHYRSFVSLAGGSMPVAELAGRKVRLCAAIGEPEVFARKMELLGARIIGKHFFPDHHFFQPEEIRRIPLQDVDYLIITRKDSVRFPAMTLCRPVLYPETELAVKGLNLC